MLERIDNKSDATETDLVIEELDQWKNPGNAVAWWCTQTFNLVVVPEETPAP